MSRWVRWLPWLAWLASAVLWVARWPTFPLALDPAYHLSIAQQMQAASGILTYEWWEAAPIGRPHLYPPVVHLLLTTLLGLGVPPIAALRVLTAAIVPAVLLTIYVTAARLSASQAPSDASDIAWGCLLACLAPFTWLLQVGEALASGLALIELLWLLVAVRERRWLAASCLTALLWYTHLGMPWIALATLGWAGVLKAIPEPRLTIRAVGWGTVAAVPWLARVVSHAGSLRLAARDENNVLELYPLLLLCAAFGVWRGWRMRDAVSRMLIALWMGSAVLAYPFLFRWLNGEGVVPLGLLAGYGVAGWVGGRTFPGARRAKILALVLGLMLAPSVVIARQPSGGGTVSVLWPDSTPLHLAGAPGIQRKATDLQLYSAHLEELTQTIARLTGPREILWSNAEYAGGLVAALAQRPTSSAMFHEVASGKAFDPVAAARWVVWFKVELPGAPDLARLVARYQLQLVSDHPLALVYRNPLQVALAPLPRAAVPLWMGFVLLYGFLGISMWQLNRRKVFVPSHG